MPAISSRLRPSGNFVASTLFASLAALLASASGCTGADNTGSTSSDGVSTVTDGGSLSTVGGASSSDVTSGTTSTSTSASTGISTSTSTSTTGDMTTAGGATSTTVGAAGSSSGVGGTVAAGGASAATTMGGASSTVDSGGAGGSGAGGTTDSGTGGTGGSTCDTSPGKAIQFAEGVIDQMTGNIGSDGPSGDGPRTLELWAKFTSQNSWTAEQTIIELGRRVDAGNQVWGIDMSGYSGNGGRFGPYTNGVTDNNGSNGPFYMAAADVGWLHLAWAYEGNGGEMVFTVNGEQLPIQDPGSNYTLDLTPGIITLGASQSFGATGWDGIMDEVRVWTVYKSPQEIADSMNVFLTGNEAGLAAYYNFDDSDGTYVDDVLGTPSHRLEPCTGNNDRCTATNNAMPTIVTSDLPGPFTCAQ